MDDRSFDEWTNALSGLRNDRLTDIKREIQEKGGSFTPSRFYGIARKNLEAIVDKWLEIEEKSWAASPPPDPKNAINESRQEFESVLEFENESIGRDLLTIQESVSWNDKDVTAERVRFEKFNSELRSNRLLKLKKIANPKAADREEETDNGKATPSKTKVIVRPPRSGSSSSGVGVFTMFLVGLLLGGGPAFYFWDLSQKKEAAHQEELQTIRTEKRNLDDQLTLVRGTFTKLAEGKIRNIPQLRKLIDPIRQKAKQDRAREERYILSRREKILKSIRPGDKQDRALANLKEEKQRKLQAINAREKKRLRPLLEELQTLREMMGQ